MARHLDQAFFESTLNRGRAIECFLGAGDSHGDEPTIRWASIRKDGDGFVVRLYEASDPRDPDLLDVYVFRSTTPEPDEPISEDSHETLESALQQVRGWGGESNRFVNEGMLGDDYGEYLARGG